MARGLNVTVGASNQDRAIEQDLGGIDRADRGLVQSIDPYRATAATARLDYQPTRWASLSASFTRLDEQRSFLGVRSLESADFGESALSDGVTLAADVKMGRGLSVFGSATASSSHTPDTAALQVRGVRATAFQAVFAKAGLFGSTDQVRLTVTQPLTVERGLVDFSMIGVVDRETGERGVITQHFNIGAPGQRRYVAEALNGASLMDGRAELSTFARARTTAQWLKAEAFTGVNRLDDARAIVGPRWSPRNAMRLKPSSTAT